MRHVTQCGGCRQSAGGPDCRVGRRPAGAAFAFEGGAAAIAFDIHFEDGRVVDQPIDGGQGHRLVGKHPAPLAEGLVGGDEQ